ncbi:PREDICTED: uncharacterized membrane protein At1g75140-like [Ipomoea nil]|uniref:uncharacterized membrane protein At1g75140-like n=1 Tax=Ipomoea nil TaxID=35883 RepID=UPI000900B3FB|nr:PREDICTED: uncharacterized membrane protein At1g75140-like [Ipomoea nil]
MAAHQQGKSFMFYLIITCNLLRICWVCASEAPIVIEKERTNEERYKLSDGLDVLNRHQKQLEKLEELVKDLSELVGRLESRISHSQSPKGERVDSKKPSIGREELGRKKMKSDELSGKLREEGGLGKKGGAVSVTKYTAFWSERFQFMSAVRLESVATCINVLPFRDFEGLSKYVAVGDAEGWVFVFSRNGDVVVKFNTLTDAPITALTSWLSHYRNESFVVTGHHNGALLRHRVWEVVQNGDEWGSLSMENVGELALPETGEGAEGIASLEVHHLGRNRFVLSTDVSGRVRVYLENGTVYGLAVPRSRPLAFLKQRLLFLTETGAGSLDLRTMRIRESECEGLNRSLVKSYVFDAAERSKAYGFTSDGDLIHVLLLGDIMNFKCRLRSRKKLDTTDEPLAFQAIKGYLLVANRHKVWLYNVSSHHYVRSAGPRLVFSAGLDEITALFLNHNSTDSNEERTTVPLIASDREKLVIIGLGSGYIGMYRPNLPVFKNEFNTMLWTSPVLLFILFLLGAWQFFAYKKEAFTSWSPDDPFLSTSIAGEASLGASQGDDETFSVPDSSRNTGFIDPRNSDLRGPAGRYVSPATPFMSATSETSARPSLIDSNFITASQLKYRGSNLETTAFPNRRDSLFINSQVVDDTNTVRSEL